MRCGRDYHFSDETILVNLLTRYKSTISSKIIIVFPAKNREGGRLKSGPPDMIRSSMKILFRLAVAGVVVLACPASAQREKPPLSLHQAMDAFSKVVIYRHENPQRHRFNVKKKAECEKNAEILDDYIVQSEDAIRKTFDTPFSPSRPGSDSADVLIKDVALYRLTWGRHPC
jgi:hypothetical protein